MPEQIARQWFIPGDGIDRYVISTDIQRYLGNDATVRPGVGTGEDQGVTGFWIKAYRNLTSAMIADLKADSGKWRQEQRITGTREPYAQSTTYNNSARPAQQRRERDGESPSLDGPFGQPQPREPQMAVQPDRRYIQPGPNFPPTDARVYARDPQPYPSDQPMGGMPDSYARQPVTSPYPPAPPRYGQGYPQQVGEAPQPGYVKHEMYYPSVSSSYEPSPAMSPSAGPPSYGTGLYGGQPAPGQNRDPRDVRDPRYGGTQPSDYPDPRYAYPSPATTVSSVNPRDREPLTSPPQPSQYGSLQSPQYDPYGRPVPNSYGTPTLPPPNNNNGNNNNNSPGYAPPAPAYGRDNRQPPQPPASSSGDTRDSRRRRLH